LLARSRRCECANHSRIAAKGHRKPKALADFDIHLLKRIAPTLHASIVEIRNCNVECAATITLELGVADSKDLWKDVHFVSPVSLEIDEVVFNTTGSIVVCRCSFLLELDVIKWCASVLIS